MKKARCCLFETKLHVMSLLFYLCIVDRQFHRLSDCIDYVVNVQPMYTVFIISYKKNTRYILYGSVVQMCDMRH